MSIEKLIKEFNTKHKKNVIARGTEILEVPRTPTGSLSMDAELGGGVPNGRIISLVGEESTGKSVIMAKMTAEFQKQYPERDVVWIDAEGVFDPKWSALLGLDVDTSRFYVMRPDYMEQAFDFISLAVNENVGWIALDSLAALAPQTVLEEEIGKATMGIEARLNKKMLKRFQSQINNQANPDIPTTLVYVNHLQENLGASTLPGRPPLLMEPGGRALRFFPSIKIEFKVGEVFPKPESSKEEIQPKAQAIKFYIKKNKTSPPFRRGHFWFYFDTLDEYRIKGTYDRLEEAFRYSLKCGIVVKRGKMYDIPNPDTGEVISFEGKIRAAEYIRDNENVGRFVEQEVLKRVKEGLVADGAALSEDSDEELLEEGLHEAKGKESSEAAGSKTRSGKRIESLEEGRFVFDDSPVPA